MYSITLCQSFITILAAEPHRRLDLDHSQNHDRYSYEYRIETVLEMSWLTHGHFPRHCTYELNSDVEVDSDLVHSTKPNASFGIRPLWQVEKEAIENAIDHCHGNVPKAAALLDISASTIYRKRERWTKLERP